MPLAVVDPCAPTKVLLVNLERLFDHGGGDDSRVAVVALGRADGARQSVAVKLLPAKRAHLPVAARIGPVQREGALRLGRLVDKTCAGFIPINHNFRPSFNCENLASVCILCAENTHGVCLSDGKNIYIKSRFLPARCVCVSRLAASFPPNFPPNFPPKPFKICRLKQYNFFFKWLGGKVGGKGLASGFLRPSVVVESALYIYTGVKHPHTFGKRRLGWKAGRIRKNISCGSGKPYETTACQHISTRVLSPHPYGMARTSLRSHWREDHARVL